MFCYPCLSNKFEIESPKYDHFCSNEFDGLGRCLMGPLFGLFGRLGLIDLAVRPDPNARIALSAVTNSGKKGHLAKLRSLVNRGLFSMALRVPGMESSGPARGPRRVSQGQNGEFI